MRDRASDDPSRVDWVRPIVWASIAYVFRKSGPHQHRFDESLFLENANFLSDPGVDGEVTEAFLFVVRTSEVAGLTDFRI